MQRTYSLGYMAHVYWRLRFGLYSSSSMSPSGLNGSGRYCVGLATFESGSGLEWNKLGKPWRLLGKSWKWIKNLRIWLWNRYSRRQYREKKLHLQRNFFWYLPHSRQSHIYSDILVQGIRVRQPRSTSKLRSRLGP